MENKIFDEYYNLITTKSDEENRIQNEIDNLTNEFNNTPVYKEYEEKKKNLYKSLIAARNERREKIRAARPERKSLSIDEFKEVIRDANKKRISELSSDAKKIMKALAQLSRKEQAEIVDLLHVRTELQPMKNKKTTDKDIWMLQTILGQTCKDFIKEKGLDDIYGIHFSFYDAFKENDDYLGDFFEANTYVEGVEVDDETGMDVRKEIGWTCC